MAAMCCLLRRCGASGSRARLATVTPRRAPRSPPLATSGLTAAIDEVGRPDQNGRMRSFIRGLPLVLLALGYAGQAHAWDFGLQCVPFARAISGIRLFGDAWRWWSEAAGRYERGQRPQPGSVLSFRPNTHMPLGHVAVVTRVVSARRIEIDHANWASPGEITTGAAAVDVSERNDW